MVREGSAADACPQSSGGFSTDACVVPVTQHRPTEQRLRGGVDAKDSTSGRDAQVWPRRRES